MRVASLLFLWLVLARCQGLPDADTPFLEGKSVGRVNRPLEEASGLVASRQHPGFLWTHNDSGHPPEIFLIDTTGHIHLTCRLAGAANRDWEDIAWGPGPEAGVGYLYLADIGDNEGQYPLKYIYRLEEPADRAQPRQQVVDVERLPVRLSDGIRDAEAFFVDPHTRDFFLFSKRESAVHVYRWQEPPKGDTAVAQFQFQLPLQGVVAADISADGTEILVKTYHEVLYWHRSAGVSVADALTATPWRLPYKPEPQGEAIAFALDGRGYFTLSEARRKVPPHLMYYPRK